MVRRRRLIVRAEVTAAVPPKRRGLSPVNGPVQDGCAGKALEERRAEAYSDALELIARAVIQLGRPGSDRASEGR